MHRRNYGILSLAMAGVVGLSCTSEPTGINNETIVTAIVPTGGATDVDPTAPIVVTFNHSMRLGMEAYMALHEGDVTGPEVPGTWSWNDDRSQLTFTPAEVLKPQTQYTLHLGGGMHDAQGNALGYQQCIGQHGGQWASQQQMGGMTQHMGAGWHHQNGTYGVLITFTTG